MATIHETNNYDTFTLVEGNRKVNPLHVKRIVESMKKQLLESPIIVNQDMEIIDGQHRFHALKKLNKPIKYIVVDGYAAEQVQMYNQNQQNWKHADFLNYFVSIGSSEYVKLDNFMAEYELSLTQARIIAQGGNKTAGDTSSFTSGNFKFSNAKADEMAKLFNQIKHLWDFSSQRSFIMALVVVLKSDKISWKELKINCLKYYYLMEKRATAKQYVEQFQNLYNYKKREKVNLLGLSV